MVIIVIGWPIIAVALGIWAVFGVASSIIYGIQNSWDEDKAAWLKTYTVKQKWGLFALLMAWMGSVAAVVYAFFYHTGGIGAAGMLGWVITSLVAAHLCSPLQLAFADGWKGCHPLLSIARLVSLLLIMVFSWVFILIAIFRKATRRLYVGILATTFAIMALVACGTVGYLFMERNAQLTAAEEQIAAGNHEEAMRIYYDMGEQEKYLETWYAHGMHNLEQGEYHAAKALLAQLAEEY